MNKVISAIATACCATMLTGAVIAADATKVYDPMSEKDKIVVPVELLSKDGNTKIGQVVIVQSQHGLVFYPQLEKLAAGMHGFHIHENPDCGLTADGLGMKAGGHWNPTKAPNHSFPWDDNGHKGDLPSLFVDAHGQANSPVLAPKLKTLDEIRDRSLMIHVGGDNYHDHPAKLGGGGARMACGIIK